MILRLEQDHTLDVTNWEEDYLFFTYPEGKRSKYALFPPKNNTYDFIIPNRRYLFKKSDKRYADQFWGEIVAYQVGCLLNVDVPPSFIAIRQTDDPDMPIECGALIQWFYVDGKARFDQAGNELVNFIEGYDRKRGLAHNFDSITKLSRIIENTDGFQDSWEMFWANAILFDALIGNTDRHQDNWGYLYSISGSNISTKRSHAPLFDNGTSLGNERFSERIKNWTDEQYLHYISKGKHHMKLTFGDAESAGHIDLVRRLKELLPGSIPTILNKIERFSVDELSLILNRMQQFNLPIKLSDSRKDVYLKLLTIRRHQIISALS